MVGPSFFVLGAPKCGTTSLYQGLKSHPDVFLAHPKEPRFFDLRYDLGIDHYLGAHYRGYDGESAVGEASPMYLYLPYVPERIRRHFPAARLIVLVRDPVSRAHSAWWMHFSAGREHLAFPEAVRENLSRLSSGIDFAGESGEYLWRTGISAMREGGRLLFRTYVDAGSYRTQIERYLELFPRRQLLVLRFEDLVSRPAEALRAVCDFIGVEPPHGLTLPHGYPAVGPGWLPVSRGSVRRLAGMLPRWAAEAAQSAMAKLSKGRPEMDQDTKSLLEQYYGGWEEELSDYVTTL